MEFDAPKPEELASREEPQAVTEALDEVAGELSAEYDGFGTNAASAALRRSEWRSAERDAADG